MSNSIKKQLGGMPTGPNRFAGQTFTVTHRKAETPLPEINFEGFELFMDAKPSDLVPITEGVHFYRDGGFLVPMQPNVREPDSLREAIRHQNEKAFPFAEISREGAQGRRFVEQPKAPYQDLAEAVERMIRLGILK